MPMGCVCGMSCERILHNVDYADEPWHVKTSAPSRYAVYTGRKGGPNRHDNDGQGRSVKCPITWHSDSRSKTHRRYSPFHIDMHFLQQAGHCQMFRGGWWFWMQRGTHCQVEALGCQPCNVVVLGWDDRTHCFREASLKPVFKEEVALLRCKQSERKSEETAYIDAVNLWIGLSWLGGASLY